MNKRESRRAAKIYALANTYHSMETSDPTTEPHMTVKELAVDWAAAELEKMGLRPCDLLSMDDCIAAAMGSNARSEARPACGPSRSTEELGSD